MRMPNYSDSDLQMPDYQMQDLLTIRSNSMFVSVIPPIDEPKVTQTTHTLVKTKSMRVIHKCLKNIGGVYS
jgi:hypothetical protein